jgi:hypothetical protein
MLHSRDWRHGNGIDRLLMALTGSGIREAILFPLVQPQWADWTAWHFAIRPEMS